MTTTYDNALHEIETELARRGYKLVTDFNPVSFRTIIYATDGLDPVGERLSIGGTSGMVAISRWATGEERGKPTGDWEPILRGHWVESAEGRRLVQPTNAEKVATALGLLAPGGDRWDTESSESRQHYIDTGHYLAHAETAVCEACGLGDLDNDDGVAQTDDDGQYPSGGILTVGELRDLLAPLDPSTHVAIATDAWYSNIETVGLPDGEGMFTVTLYPGVDLDTRQF